MGHRSRNYFELVTLSFSAALWVVLASSASAQVCRSPIPKPETRSRRLACGTRPSAAPAHAQKRAAFPRFADTPADPVAPRHESFGIGTNY